MRVCVSVIPGSLLLLTLLMNYFMPINKKYMETVASELKARKVGVLKDYIIFSRLKTQTIL